MEDKSQDNKTEDKPVDVTVVSEEDSKASDATETKETDNVQDAQSPSSPDDNKETEETEEATETEDELSGQEATPKEPEVQKEENLSPVAQQSSGNDIPTTAPAADDTAPAAVGIAASQMNKVPHRNNKRLAVIVTLVVALLLAGIAVYVYSSTNNNTENFSPTIDNSQQQNGQNPAGPATASDIDQATQDIDSAINGLNDSTDFSEEGLSDTSLGL